jgi:hypothetical protein
MPAVQEYNLTNFLVFFLYIRWARHSLEYSPGGPPGEQSKANTSGGPVSFPVIADMSDVKHEPLNSTYRVAGLAGAAPLFVLAILFLFFPGCGFVQFCMSLIADDDALASPRPFGMPIALFGLLTVMLAGNGKWWD